MLGSVPAGAAMVAVAIQGTLDVDVTGEGDYRAFAGPMQVRGVDTPETPRRQIVSSEKCAQCHERLALHGGLCVGNPNGCVLCHNPNATDIEVRPADGSAAGQFADFNALGVDGRRERSVDFRIMVHKIHMREQLTEPDYTIYGFRRSVQSYGHVRYPRDLRACQACHLPKTYTVPVASEALATTMRSADAATTEADLEPATDDRNLPPATAACVGCHDRTGALDHARASSADWSSDIHGSETENCADCHGAGKEQDVEAVHAVTGVVIP